MNSKDFNELHSAAIQIESIAKLALEFVSGIQVARARLAEAVDAETARDKALAEQARSEARTAVLGKEIEELTVRKAGIIAEVLSAEAKIPDYEKEVRAIDRNLAKYRAEQEAVIARKIEAAEADARVKIEALQRDIAEMESRKAAAEAAILAIRQGA